MALPLKPRVAQPQLMIFLSRRCRRMNLFYHFQIGTIPRNRNMRAPIREILEHQFCAAALEEALRDEDAEPHMVRRTGARRNIGLTQTPEQMKRISRPVIGDL